MDYQSNRPSQSSSYSLGNLAQQAQKLNSQLASSSNAADLPSIQLGLDQIEKQSRKLVARGGAGSINSQGLDPRAHYFLANAGIDAAELSENINSTNIASAFEPLEPIYDTDVQSFLRHEHEQVILSAIEEGRRETLEDFHRNLERSMHRDWEFQKRKIFDELGQHHPGSDHRDAEMDWASGNNAAGRGFIPAASTDLSRTLAPSGGQSMHMHGRMMRYNAVIEELNESRLSSTAYPIVSNLLFAARSMASQQSPDARNQPLIETYEILVSIIGESDVSTQTGEFQRSVIREREFSNAYINLHNWNQGREGIDLRRKIIQGSKKSLELQFLNHIDQLIESDPIKAQLGGKPSIENKIRAFLRVSLLNKQGFWPEELELIRIEKKADGSHENLPVWAILFHLVRIGHLKEALDFSFQNEANFKRLDQSFPSYFKAFLESKNQTLPRNLRDRFLNDFNSRFRSTSSNISIGNRDGIVGIEKDPYKFAIYKIIGRIDLNKKFPNSLIKTTENWLWLQLSMVREEEDDLDLNPANGAGDSSFFDPNSTNPGAAAGGSRDSFTLEMLSKKLREYGENHFDPKGTKPLHYFQVLLLSAQFERAIAFLYSRPQYQVEAVQFASALAYYGLLRVPSSAQSSQVEYLTLETDPTSGKEIAYLDFSKIIQRYIRIFSQNDAREALQYLYLICLSSDSPAPTGAEQVTKCHEMIKNLVMETRQFEELLGSVNPDGSKRLGLIEKNSKLINLTREKDYLLSIVSSAAKASENQNRIKDSTLLYNLAQEYDVVVQVLNKELGANLMEPTARNSLLNLGDEENSNHNQVNQNLSTAPDLISLARLILINYSKQNHIIRSISVENFQTLKILLKLKESILYFHSSEYERSLSTMESLDLIPLRSSPAGAGGPGGGDLISITKKAEDFKSINPNISKNLDHLLLMIMKILFNLNQSYKNSQWNDSIRMEKLKEIRNKSRCLMLWSGMLRFRLSSETYAQLTRLDVFIH